MHEDFLYKRNNSDNGRRCVICRGSMYRKWTDQGSRKPERDHEVVGEAG